MALGFLTLTVLVAVFGMAFCQAIDKTYIPKGKNYTCLKCSDGQRIIMDCEPNRINTTQCGPCPNGTYNPRPSASRDCSDCKTSCEPKQMVIQNCSDTHDLECDCKPDHIKTKYSGDEMSCKPCGELKILNKGGQECIKCPKNKFYLKSAPNEPAVCLPCDQCQNTKGANCTQCSDGTNYGLIVGLPVSVLIIIIIAVLFCMYKQICCFSRGDREASHPNLHNLMPFSEMDTPGSHTDNKRDNEGCVESERMVPNLNNGNQNQNRNKRGRGTKMVAGVAGDASGVENIIVAEKFIVFHSSLAGSVNIEDIVGSLPRENVSADSLKEDSEEAELTEVKI